MKLVLFLMLTNVCSTLFAQMSPTLDHLAKVVFETNATEVERMLLSHKIHFKGHQGEIEGAWIWGIALQFTEAGFKSETRNEIVLTWLKFANSLGNIKSLLDECR